MKNVSILFLLAFTFTLNAQNLYSGLSGDLFNITEEGQTKAHTLIAINADYTIEADETSLEVALRFRHDLSARFTAIASIDLMALFFDYKSLKIQLGTGVMLESAKHLNGVPGIFRISQYINRFRIRGEVRRNIFGDHSGPDPTVYDLSVAVKIFK